MSRFDPTTGHPLPPANRPLVEIATGLSLVLIATGMVALVVVGLRWAMEPMPAGSPASSQTLRVDWSGFPLPGTPPPFPARLEMVVLEPTPTYAPPRPTSTPSPRPLFCPDDPNTLPNGTICRGVAPLPTPTAMPTCRKPVAQGVDCVVRHSHLGTPEAIPGISNALVEEANDIDHEQVKRDAQNYPLSPAFAALPAVTPVPKPDAVLP